MLTIILSKLKCYVILFSTDFQNGNTQPALDVYSGRYDISNVASTTASTVLQFAPLCCWCHFVVTDPLCL